MSARIISSGFCKTMLIALKKSDRIFIVLMPNILLNKMLIQQRQSYDVWFQFFKNMMELNDESK